MPCPPLFPRLGQVAPEVANREFHNQVEAMADIDHYLLESPAATAATTTSSVDDDDGGFTFSAVSPLASIGESFPADGRIGLVYPVFGRPRSPPLPEHEEEEPASSATVRVPLGQLLLKERGSSSPGQQPDDDGAELDGVPAETYCLWSPGRSPAAAGPQSPARCQKSGSTGSVLRWRQRLLGRSSSDGTDKFVYILNTMSSERHADGRHGRGGDDGNGGKKRWSFLPSSNKDDLVGLFANAVAFRRSCHPF
ncbi:hypothetical protein PR202_gb02157 [Eleusine coracana subsp. coracana]|uniref:Uncharacterized protein n=1 Tax=Eleusine coracana subsp. coracana TaxID=191504 RepID=A0AAV5DYG4_ELECO|nr:hypothetical protein PR202_gb02157 [Eleusine coracana subsp. coracana]